MASKKNATTSTTAPRNGPQMSDDIAAQAAALGFDPSQLFTGGQPASAADPPVWDGHDIVPTSKAYADFYDLDGKQLRQFQDRAFAAGLYGSIIKTQIRFDDHDDTSFQIWRSLVDRSAGYNATGKKVSPLDALDEAVTNSPTFGTLHDPLTAQVSNPADIRLGIRAAAKELLGQGDVDEQQLQRMVAAFQSSQKAAQQASYSMQDTGGTVVAPPSLDAFAEQQIHTMDPVGYDAHKALGAIDQIAQIMRGN